MKKILTLILLLSFFSCDKDEPDTLSAKYSKQEIFNAVVGTWKFSRLGYDPEFKRIKNVEAKPCTEFDRTIFKKDSTVFITFLEGCNNYAPDEIGNFYVKFGGNDPNGTYVVVHLGGIFTYPGLAEQGAIPLYSFTDSTLVFSEITYYSDNGDKEFHLYSELKRVK